MAEAPDHPWRAEFLGALRLLARASERLSKRGLPRPVLVGGGAVFFNLSAVLVATAVARVWVKTDLDVVACRRGHLAVGGPEHIVLARAGG